MNPREFYSKAWDVLVQFGQVPNRPYERESFVRYFLERGTEWRFGGSLGFGGKFWADTLGKRHYITCYPEDSTPEREKLIREVNARLAALEWW